MLRCDLLGSGVQDIACKFVFSLFVDDFWADLCDTVFSATIWHIAGILKIRIILDPQRVLSGDFHKLGPLWKPPHGPEVETPFFGTQMGVSKIGGGGYLFGDPDNKDYNGLVSILGSPILASYQICVVVRIQVWKTSAPSLGYLETLVKLDFFHQHSAGGYNMLFKRSSPCVLDHKAL